MGAATEPERLALAEAVGHPVGFADVQPLPLGRGRGNAKNGSGRDEKLAEGLVSRPELAQEMHAG